MQYNVKWIINGNITITAESKEHMETHILKRMFERHGVDHVMCNQYTIGKNKEGKLTKDDPTSPNYHARRILW